MNFVLHYPPDANLPLLLPRFSDASVAVRDEKALDAARRLTQDGERPAILNFAAAHHPGGGWRDGVSGQEEDLCRETLLAERLESDAARPMYAHHQHVDWRNSNWCMYAPRVPHRWEPWTADFISCAAPDLRQAPAQVETHDLFTARISRVLHVAAVQGHSSVVLGAWGCGHFRNAPRVVAQAFKVVLEQYKRYFATVLFAIYDTSPSQEALQVFTRELESPSRPSERA